MSAHFRTAAEVFSASARLNPAGGSAVTATATHFIHFAPEADCCISAAAPPTSSGTPRQLFFNQPADQWAVTHLLGLTTRDQLHLAFHILGLASSSNTEHRKLSLSRLARDLGYSRQTVTPLKDRLVAEQLLVELVIPGKSSLYGLGPALASSRYLELVEQYESLARARQLQWPFNGCQRTGAANTKQVPAQSERAGTCSVRLSTPPAQSERATPAQPERAPIETLREFPLEKSLESKPPAEVEHQASGLTASSPASLPEQPAADQQAELAGAGDELAGAGSELAGAGQGMTIQQAALYQQQQYNKQKQEEQQQRNISNTETAQNSSTPELQPWGGPPVEVLATDDVLQHVDGFIGVVEVGADHWGRYVHLHKCIQDLSGLTPVFTIHVITSEDLKGWRIVESQQVDGIALPAIDSGEAEVASVLIPAGSRITVDGSLAELITISSDWDESPDADTVLAHPPGEPSAMKRYKINTITVL